MLKREIVYEDFDGDTVKDVFYFNISKHELVELNVEHADGMEKMLKKIIDTKDHKELLKKFQEIILLAYGIKSEDGKRFIKSDDLRKEFSQMAAYDALFMELATDEGAAATFIKGILPKEFGESIDKVVEVPQVQADKQKENNA